MSIFTIPKMVTYSGTTNLGLLNNYIDMKDRFEIERLKENVREQIVLAMRRRVSTFKDYVTTVVLEFRHPEYELIMNTDYGCKDDNRYYCYLPKTDQFIYLDNCGYSNLLIFNDKIKCWFAYDKDKKETVTFEALDTDAQIAFLNMLDLFLDRENWSFIPY